MRPMPHAKRETTGSIAQWQQETFGHAGSAATVAARANIEMAELLDKVSRGRPPSVSISDFNADLMEEAADVIITLCALPVFLGYPDAFKSRLWGFVDHKMAINRGRAWTVDATGRGQHVPEPGE